MLWVPPSTVNVPVNVPALPTASGTFTSVVIAAVNFDAFTPMPACAATITVTPPGTPWWRRPCCWCPLMASRRLDLELGLDGDRAARRVMGPGEERYRQGHAVVRPIAVPVAPRPAVGQTNVPCVWLGAVSVQVAPLLVIVTAIPWRVVVQVADVRVPAVGGAARNEQPGCGDERQEQSIAHRETLLWSGRDTRCTRCEAVLRLHGKWRVRAVRVTPERKIRGGFPQVRIPAGNSLSSRHRTGRGPRDVRPSEFRPSETVLRRRMARFLRRSRNRSPAASPLESTLAAWVGEELLHAGGRRLRTRVRAGQAARLRKGARGILAPAEPCERLCAPEHQPPASRRRRGAQPFLGEA